MRNSVVLFFLVCCNIAFSQIGKVSLKNSKFKVGEENTYVYVPPKGMAIPKEARVKIVYKNKDLPDNVAALLIKKSNAYEFSVKVPDSTRSLLIAVFEGKKIVDNNQNKGYGVYLRTSTPTETGKCIVDKMKLIGYANVLSSFKLDEKPKTVLEEYNKVYAAYPMMKKDPSYGSYLYLKYSNKEISEQELLKFIQECEKKNTEEYLMAAFSLYGELKMDDKIKQIMDQISEKYPNGELEKYRFKSEFMIHPNKTEQYVLESLKAYSDRFSNISEKSKDLFYVSLLRIYLKNKDVQKLEQYEALSTDKNMVASIYNSFAWELSGEDLVTPSKDIEYAEKISKRSLDVVAKMQKESLFPEDFQGSYFMLADTYALILYKMNKFEEAFQYQDGINQLGGLGTEGKERYAVMMEKVKGPEFTKKYIEMELGKGVESRTLLAQLGEIYKQLNLPVEDFNKIKEKSIAATNAKKNEDIVKRLGSTKAIDFNLKNLEGKEIKLSDLKGKVVVLDFWATWCGPCRASFPKMQELVSKYKGKDVEFLFVDTWERGKENTETVDKVGKFIDENKYSFNVVFDFDDSITAKYKVEGVPTKVVIDKKGSVIAYGSSEQDLMLLIDEQLSL